MMPCGRWGLGLLLLVVLALSPVHSPAIAAVVQADAAGARVAIEVGKGRLIRLDRPAASVFIADPAIADVQVRSPRLVYLFGRGPGETSFFAVDSADRVVTSLDVSVGYDFPLLERALAEALPGRRLSLGMANDALVIAGSVDTPAEAEDAVRLATRFVAGADRGRVINKIAVHAPTQINLRVRFAEVSRDLVRAIGFNWDGIGRIGDAAVGIAVGRPVFVPSESGLVLNTRAEGANNLVGTFANGDVDLSVLLDALDNRGLATVLAEPNLTALSGVPASFLAGGEFPIPVPQAQNVTTIDYKRFGVSLSFVATITDGNRINLTVKPEVSQLTSVGAISINGFMVPALTTRRVETTVDLASGQSFAIAGLLQNGSREDLKRFPGLGELPVIGALFRSRRFERQETELVVIVTPYLVRPTDAGALAEPRAGGARP
ncbi:MAG: type II and III secretion system protein family protein [Thermaurantiacus sp.]